jgi:hypothetical protein
VITLLGVLTALALWPAAIGLDGVHWSEIGRVWPYVFTLIALNVPWFYLLVGLGRLMRKLRSNKRPEVPTVQDERG